MALIGLINDKVTQQVPKRVQEHESPPYFRSEHRCHDGDGGCGCEGVGGQPVDETAEWTDSPI